MRRLEYQRKIGIFGANVELRHLRYFLAVAHELHFGLAAKRLNMSQPPLSQQIIQLEEELGVKLFVRTKRRVQLTRAGQLFEEECRKILLSVDQAASIAVRADKGQIGQLTIGSVPSVHSGQHGAVVNILRTYARRHPHIHISLRSLTTPKQIEALHTGRIDVGFLTANLAHDPILTAKPIHDDQLMLAIPRGNHLAAHKRVSLAILAREPFILVSRHLAPAYYDLIVTWFRDHDISVNVVYESDNLFNALTLVECGLGVAFLPAGLTDATQDVIFKKVAATPPSLDLLLAYRRNLESEVVRSFLAIVDEVVPRKRKRQRPTNVRLGLRTT